MAAQDKNQSTTAVVDHGQDTPGETGGTNTANRVAQLMQPAAIAVQVPTKSPRALQHLDESVGSFDFTKAEGLWLLRDAARYLEQYPDDITLNHFYGTDEELRKKYPWTTRNSIINELVFFAKVEHPQNLIAILPDLEKKLGNLTIVASKVEVSEWPPPMVQIERAKAQARTHHEPGMDAFTALQTLQGFIDDSRSYDLMLRQSQKLMAQRKEEAKTALQEALYEKIIQKDLSIPGPAKDNLFANLGTMGDDIVSQVAPVTEVNLQQQIAARLPAVLGEGQTVTEQQKQEIILPVVQQTFDSIAEAQTTTITAEANRVLYRSTLISRAQAYVFLRNSLAEKLQAQLGQGIVTQSTIDQAAYLVFNNLHDLGGLTAEGLSTQIIQDSLRQKFGNSLTETQLSELTSTVANGRELSYALELTNFSREVGRYAYNEDPTNGRSVATASSRVAAVAEQTQQPEVVTAAKTAAAYAPVETVLVAKNEFAAADKAENPPRFNQIVRYYSQDRSRPAYQAASTLKILLQLGSFSPSKSQLFILYMLMASNRNLQLYGEQKVYLLSLLKQYANTYSNEFAQFDSDPAIQQFLSTLKQSASWRDALRLTQQDVAHLLGKDPSTLADAAERFVVTKAAMKDNVVAYNGRHKLVDGHAAQRQLSGISVFIPVKPQQYEKVGPAPRRYGFLGGLRRRNYTAGNERTRDYTAGNERTRDYPSQHGGPSRLNPSNLVQNALSKQLAMAKKALGKLITTAVKAIPFIGLPLSFMLGGKWRRRILAAGTALGIAWLLKFLQDKFGWLFKLLGWIQSLGSLAQIFSAIGSLLGGTAGAVLSAALGLPGLVFGAVIVPVASAIGAAAGAVLGYTIQHLVLGNLQGAIFGSAAGYYVGGPLGAMSGPFLGSAVQWVIKNYLWKRFGVSFEVALHGFFDWIGNAFWNTVGAVGNFFQGIAGFFGGAGSAIGGLGAGLISGTIGLLGLGAIIIGYIGITGPESPTGGLTPGLTLTAPANVANTAPIPYTLTANIGNCQDTADITNIFPQQTQYAKLDDPKIKTGGIFKTIEAVVSPDKITWRVTLSKPNCSNSQTTTSTTASLTSLVSPQSPYALTSDFCQNANPSGCSANLKQLYEAAAAWANIPAAVIAGIGNQEWKATFKHTDSEIDQWSKPGIKVEPNGPLDHPRFIAGCARSFSYAEGPMQFLTGKNGKLNVWASYQSAAANAGIRPSGYNGEACNVVDAIFGAAKKLKSNSGIAFSERKDVWAQEDVYNSARAYLGACTPSYNQNLNYCEGVWQYYRTFTPREL